MWQRVGGFVGGDGLCVGFFCWVFFGGGGGGGCV